jgi:peroxiredoxin
MEFVMKNIWIIILGLVLCGCIKEKAGRDLEVGDRLPDFEVIMNDGSVISDDVLKEQTSVVMFFHTSCPDCQQALPRMQQLYDEYASKGVVFALISREEAAEEIDSYFRLIGLEMPYSAQTDRTVFGKFAQTRIPRIYICEKGGIIRHIFTDDPVPSYSELENSLESLIR